MRFLGTCIQCSFLPHLKHRNIDKCIDYDGKIPIKNQGQIGKNRLGERVPIQHQKTAKKNVNKYIIGTQVCQSFCGTRYIC